MTLFVIFVVVMLLVFAVVAFLIAPTKTDKQIHARLAGLESQFGREDEPEDEILRRTTFSTIPWLDEFLRRNDLARNLQVTFEQANLDWSVGRFVFASLLCAALGIAFGTYYVSAGIYGWAIGVLAGAVPLIYVKRKRAQRLRRFDALLPDAIDLMSRALRAGHAVPACIEMVGAELADPVGPEFKRAADEQSYGLPFREAMLNLAQRIPVPDLQFLVTAMLVQKETGGNLAEILDKTAEVLRGRIRLEGQVRVHTAQGRLTGALLCALPFVSFLGISVINRTYVQVLFEDPVGQKMVQVALGLMLIGVLLIRKIVNVKV
jgi:tight adherence protein B